MIILSDEQIRQALAAAIKDGQLYGDDGRPLPEKAVAEAAYRETLKRVARLNKFPQCKGIVITVEDWEALNKLEVSNGR